MQTNTHSTDAETIAALAAKCALLATSLKQAEAEGHKASQTIAGKLEDCAVLLECHASWNLALFQAIELYTATEPMSTDALTCGPRQTVAQLAGIGIYLADNAWSTAVSYKGGGQHERHNG